MESLGPTDPISGLVAAVHSTVGGVSELFLALCPC